jgi:threonylcarbamoyladenosine tRNA methylthiotransferase MtaB
VRGWIRHAGRLDPDALILAVGCYSELDGPALTSLGTGVLALPQSRKDSLHDLAAYLKRTGPILAREGLEKRKRRVENHLKQLSQRPPSPFSFDVSRYSLHSRAFLKIQDGCDYGCAYCIVPLARGPSVSLSTDAVLDRVRRLENEGYREIVLTGVNIASYNHEDESLSSLLDLILKSTASVRIRLSSLEPDQIVEEMRDVVSHERICPHFHIPVQSGSDRVLKAMKRRYNAKRVLESIDLLRSVKPEAHFAADFIVGFPGETESDFSKTEELVRAGGFVRLHVFPFSPREGTAAKGMNKQVHEAIKTARVKRLRELSAERLKAYTKSWKGRSLTAVVEDEISADGTASGLSGNYLKLVIHGIPKAGKSGKLVRSGSLVSCRITDAENPCSAEFVTLL